MKCVICTLWNSVSEDGRCQKCMDRMDGPPEHIHNWKGFRFSENSRITYYKCESEGCELTAMVAEQFLET